MRTVAPLLCLLIAFGAAAHARAEGLQTGRPVVVELFTSQGCSACGKAAGLIESFAARDDVLPLTFSVDYWDYLGWTDTFAKPEFTERQRAYMRRLSVRNAYTPQVVVDGRSEASGSRGERVEALVEAAEKVRPKAPRMSLFARRFVRVEAGQAPKGGAELWLVRYQPEAEAVEVTEGENRGETVRYVNAVRELTRLGSWTGGRRTYALPPIEENAALKSAVILQGAKGGGVLSILEH